MGRVNGTFDLEQLDSHHTYYRLLSRPPRLQESQTPPPSRPRSTRITPLSYDRTRLARRTTTLSSSPLATPARRPPPARRATPARRADANAAPALHAGSAAPRRSGSQRATPLKSAPRRPAAPGRTKPVRRRPACAALSWPRRPRAAASLPTGRRPRQRAIRPGRGGSTSSRSGSRPASRSAIAQAVWAWRRRRSSPSGMTSTCSLSAGGTGRRTGSGRWRA